MKWIKVFCFTNNYFLHNYKINYAKLPFHVIIIKQQNSGWSYKYLLLKFRNFIKIENNRS